MNRALVTIVWGCSACVSVGTVEARAGAPIFDVLKDLVTAHDSENPECGAARRLRFATSIELGPRRGLEIVRDQGEAI